MSFFHSSLSQELFNKIVYHSDDSIMITDKNGIVVFVTKHLAERLQVTQAELLGASLQSLVDRGILTESPSLQALHTKAAVTSVFTAPVGNMLLQAVSTPLFDENGSLYAVITTTRRSEMLDKYIDALAQEQQRSHNLASALSYLTQQQSDLIYKSPKTEALVQDALRIAASDSTVILTGESGTGKEVFARFIHNCSPCAKGPFLPVNCSAIVPELAEAEFFGYTRGAFSGADPKGKAGLFDMADGGTLFLDEIGDLPLSLQGKLLRVLERNEVRPVGASSAHPIRVRIICATNRNLNKMAEEGSFRKDLYFRLNILPLHLLPLHQRQEDILPLAKHFLQQLNLKYNTSKIFAPEVRILLESYDWPGNIRELKNLIERSYTLSINSIIAGKDLLFPQRTPSAGHNVPVFLPKILEDIEKDYILNAYAQYGSIRKAAAALGLSPTAFARKLRRLQQEVVPKTEQ